jgi:predicted phosphodiesterase
MRVAILSDVHANLPALETFVARTRGVADAYLCLGDVVNYGPWNDECLELVRSLPNIVILEGNHERLFDGRDAIEHELPLVQAFYEHSRKSFTRRDLLAGLPTTHEMGSFLCTHTIENRRIYADTDVAVTRNHLIGHTHHQYAIERSGKLIVNCGSVGQNRGTIDIVHYALYDSASDHITLCEAPYPVDTLIGELVARGYPQRCVDYYRAKPRRGGR